MASWHQSKARRRSPAPLYHATLWTVLSDPIGEMSSSMLFSTEAEATAYVEKRRALGTAGHLIILPPGKPVEVPGYNSRGAKLLQAIAARARYRAGSE